MQNLLTHKHIVSNPIQEGDAGIVLKRDGSFQLFSTGAIDADNLSPEQISQAKILNALAVALAIPQIMEVLFRMAEDPDIVGNPGVRINQSH
jgi:hypothetical protein